MEDGNTTSVDGDVLLSESITKIEVQDDVPGEEVPDEGVDTGIGDGDITPDESVVVVDDTEINVLLTSLLEQSTELTEVVQLTYDEAHIPLHEVTVDTLGFSDFMLLGIFLVLLAEFILKHLGGIFRCTK